MPETPASPSTDPDGRAADGVTLTGEREDPAPGAAAGSTGPAWVARLRPHATALGLLLLTVAATLRYLAPGLDGRLDADAGLYAYGGQQAAEGVPPYVSVLNRSGPLGHLVPGGAVLVARWTGGDDLTAMRVLYLALSVATVGLVYLLAVWALRSRLAGLVAGATMLSFHGFAAYAAYGPREKTLLVFFLVVTLALAARGRWLLAGAGVAAATLTWQPAFLVAFPAVVTVALLRRREPGSPGRAAALLRVVLGGSAPALAAVACYAALGQLRVALDAFLFINLRYTTQSGFFADWPGKVGLLAEREGWPALLVAVGLLALLALGGRSVARARGSWALPAPQATLAGLGVATAACLAVSVRAFGSWPDLFLMLPLGAIGTGALALAAVRVLPRPGGTAVAVVLVLLTTAAAVSHVGWLRENDQLRVQRELAERVEAALGPDATVLALSVPELLVVMERRNPVRFQKFGNGLKPYYRENLPGGLEGLARRIDRLEPDLVISRSGAASGAWRRPFLADSTRVGTIDGLQWYAAPSLPAGRRRALAGVLADYDADDMSSLNILRPSR